MKRKAFIALTTLCVVAVVVFAIAKLTSSMNDNAYFKVNPAFRTYISGFTSGVVSTDTKVVIKLNFDFASDTMIGKACKLDLFRFNPQIKGQTFWTDKQTVEFRPDQKLPHDKTYKIDFNLFNLITVPDSMKIFKFHIKTMKQGLSVELLNVKPYDVEKGQNYKYVKIMGAVNTADVADNEKVEKAISNDKKLKISWIHDQKTNTHQFFIDSVERKQTPQQVIISWNGKPIEATQEGELKVEIPAINDFKVTNAKAFQFPDQHIVLQFSDPLDEKQNTDGLIRLKSNFRVLIEDNEIKIYPNDKLKNEVNIIIEKAITNSLGKTLEKNVSKMVVFEEIKPNVRLTGKGVIVPSTNGLVFPFEAVNLKAVKVRIIKIFEKNVLQFLQVNEIDGKREIKRVGRQIFNKTIELNGEGIVDYSSWNSFSLNLDELVKTEPGAIYQVNISFTKENSMYPCTGESGKPVLKNFKDTKMDNEADDTFDGYYDDYYDYYEDEYYSYNWEDRDDPCKDSYYYNKSVSRNFIASDLGIIAKKGNDETVQVFVNDLRTTEPLSNVKIELYNFQEQLLTSETTNGDGIAILKTSKTPAFLIAKSDKQRGYLKLNNNTALSLSMFDISGSSSDNDLKGYIYGERGVWRPGDTLFLTFILEDRTKKLPSSHPIGFTLTNPQGQITYHTIKTVGLNGFYPFTCTTSPDAPTGNWTATVDVGGVMFTKTIKIETIMPNRLKILLDFGGDKLYAHQEKPISLKSVWLHGAVAQNLKADVNVSLSKMKTEFKNFKGYVFDDNSRYFNTEEYEIFNGKLNDNGEALIKPDFNFKKAAPGVLMANFQVRVFENSGAFSIDRVSIPYYPYSTYVGLKAPEGKGYNKMLRTDETHKVSIVNVDAMGNIVKGGTVVADLYKIDWNWWWDNSGEEGASYINSYYMTPVTTEEIKLPTGTGVFNMKIDAPDWGRFFLRVTDNESGHSCGEFIYVDYPEWENRSRTKETGAATLLTLSSNKQSYNVGDKVEITFPSSKQGRALVSIEKGSKILKTYWVKTESGNTSFTFEATKEMAPNVFANVTFIQPHAQVANDLPIRLYGVIPINVEDKNTILKPVITMPNLLKPEQKSTISVSEENKKPMTYTLAIVDEGLLDLTRFKTPNPWTYFYAKEALGIRTWDLYDYVAGAYAGKLSRLLNIGGDGEGVRPDVAKANRFKPMVRFIGPFNLEKGKTNKHVVTIPNYIGSVRVMVVAGQNGAYGNAEKTVAVRNPLMILGTLPRVLGPDETVELPVSVFAMESFVKNVNIEIKTNNMFKVIGDVKKSLTFTQTGDKMVTFSLKTSSAIGIGNVKIIATSGNQKAVYDIEIDIRNPNPKVVDVFDFVVEPGKTINKKFKTNGIAGTNKGTVEISSIPPLNLDKRLKYLIAYPYGCIEQTTSAAFPQLFLENLVELNKEEKDKIQYNVNAAIKKIASLQLANGGLTYWAGSNYTDDWATNYAGHFMIEAANKGYNLPSNFMDKLLKYQKNMANAWIPNTKYYNSDLVQAYRLYTLALAKAPEMGAMNRLKEQKDLSVSSKWRLAATYQIAGQNKTAMKIIENLSTQINPYRELYYTYGSDIRDKAMILETLTLMKQKIKAAELVRTLSASMASDEWMSTQTTAYSLLALSQYYKAMGSNAQMSYTYKTKNINGTYTGKTFVNQVNMLLKGNPADDVLEVKNNGKAIMFGRIMLEGIPQPGQEKASENNLKMKINYFDLKGKKIDITKISQGTDFIAEVSVSNPGMRGEYNELALTHIIPPGWEIHNTRMDLGSSTLKMGTYNFMDIRDDRIYLHFNLRPNETKLYQFMFNASYIGKYYLPSIYTEAMYDATINAKIPGRWVEVVQSK